MLGVNLASSRAVRLCLLGVATVAVAVGFTNDTADARRRHRHRPHHVAASSYNPPFASIIVDANSGSVLQATNPDSLRHPASLTKIMTLYLLFEKLESGKLSLDTPLPVSENAAEQAPTKLGLRPGQTIRVEDAIKGLVTRSANDAAVVIAEAIGGSEEDFARAMTRKARALGMSRTVYHNASGLPDDAQVTTARDQALLGRAIQERFPKYYRYFSTDAFNFRGRVIRNHNHLLGSVEGVDGIKTGYTRASGFNLVTSLKRGNRYLIGVVLGGRSGGSRDAIMRNLLAEHIDEASTKRTVAAIVERNVPDTRIADAAPAGKGDDDEDDAAPAQPQAPAPQQVAAAPVAAPVPVPAPAPARVAAAAQPSSSNDKAPAPLTSGVVASQSFAAIPGSSEPMTPVRVKTLHVRMGQTKVASAAPGAGAAAPAPVATATIPPARKADVAETTRAALARAETRPEFPAPLPGQPNTSNGIGQGIIGTPSAVQAPQATASSETSPRGAPPTTLAAQAQALQATAPQPQPAPAPVQMQTAAVQSAPAKPTARSGWIIQVGALESESEARQRLDAARGTAGRLLSQADPFTETVAKGDKKLYRARFAGLDKDSAEAACRTLKRKDISCIAIRN